jgi:hypothetical protein
MTATQVGGTAASNDGNGTYMTGSGAASGSIYATDATTCGATAGSVGGQGQSHSYVQTADNGAGQTQ